MQPVSEKFLPALTTDHGLEIMVSALYNGAVVQPDIAVTDCSVHIDAGSDIRRTVSLTLPSPADFPATESDPYAVYGQQLYVERGIRYTDGSVERVPVGTFIITSVSGDIHHGPLAIAGSSAELLIKRAPFDTATSTNGLTAAGFISAQIAAAVPAASFVNRSTSGATTLPTKTWNAGDDRWAALCEVATAIGAELFCDANGTFVLADIPDIITATPVWTVSTGDAGVMVSADVALSADDVYNRVIASGENAEDNVPPVSAEARITDPTDPLRWDGPFGRVTEYYTSSLLTSQTAAQMAANARLRLRRAPNRTVSLQAVPNPALAEGDCIRVDYGPAAPAELHIVQSIDLPRSGACTIETVSGREVA